MDAFKNFSILLDDSCENTNANKNFFIKDFISKNVDNIFSNNDLCKEKIICIGQVQSGKTQNIIKCIDKAIELDYDGIIFFAGSNNTLLQQSYERVNKNKSEWKELGYSVLPLNSEHKINSYISNNKKFIICVIKALNGLDNTFNSLNNSNLNNKKILIIDDESDFGSINTGNIENPTLFYKKLEDLYKRIKFGKLIYFTGTPYANILNGQNISNEVPKIVVLYNSEEYYGIKKFNDANNNHYISIWNSKKDIKSDYSLIYNTIVIHLYYASKLNLNEFNKTQLLINYDSKISKHEEILESIKKIIFELLDKNSFEIKEIFLEIIRDFKINEKDFFLNNYESFYEKIKEILNYYCEEKSFYLLNGKDKEGKEIFLSNTFKYEIIVGGVMLSRGITFPNLITELILNYSIPFCVDTLLQRCRWFGYREKNKDYIRIILTKEYLKALYLVEKYVNIFEPGIKDFKKIKNEIFFLDKHIDQKQKGVRSTNHEKSK